MNQYHLNRIKGLLIIIIFRPAYSYSMGKSRESSNGTRGECVSYKLIELCHAWFMSAVSTSSWYVQTVSGICGLMAGTWCAAEPRGCWAAQPWTSGVNESDWLPWVRLFVFFPAMKIMYWHNNLSVVLLWLITSINPSKEAPDNFFQFWRLTFFLCNFFGQF